MSGPEVIYFTATSLDGYIADTEHSLQWLFDVEHGGDETDWNDLMRRAGALVMGASTYRWIIAHDPDLLAGPEAWQRFYGDRACWVFTHADDLPRIPGATITFVQGAVRPVYDEIAATGVGAIWLAGGGDLVGQFDDAGLLDEIIAGICPVTLGGGAPLLPRRIESDRLHLRKVVPDGQQVRLHYRVTRRSEDR